MTDKKELMDKLGVSDEDLQQHKDVKDSAPTLSVSQLLDEENEFSVPHVDVELVNPDPEVVTVTRADGEEDDVPIVKVSNSGVVFTLWLSSKSLKTAYASCINEGADAIRSTASEGHHPKYGATTYYDCDVIDVDDIDPLPDTYMDSYQ